MQKVHHVVGCMVAVVVGGVVLAQVAGGFVLAEVAPLVQGWSKGEQDQLALLGEGGCRLADGGEGDPVHLAGLSSDQCRAECTAEDGKCTAFEYNTNNGQCEVHSGPIVKFEAAEGVFCYLRNSS